MNESKFPEDGVWYLYPQNPPPVSTNVMLIDCNGQILITHEFLGKDEPEDHKFYPSVKEKNIVAWAVNWNVYKPAYVAEAILKRKEENKGK